MVLAVNHLSDQLKAKVGSQIDSVRVLYSVEETPLGTAGPIKLAEHLLHKESPFFVINGDIASNIDIRGMLALHAQKKADATIALVSAIDPSQYGSVTTNSNGIVRTFSEKSSGGAGRSWVNAGVYVVSPRVISLIPPGRPVSLEKDVFPKLAKNGTLHSWRHDGFWYDIGRISEYIRANRELLKMQDLNKEVSRVERRGTASIVNPSFLGKEVMLGSNAEVGPDAVLCDNVSLADGATVRDSIIFESTTIGERSVVDGTVIGENVAIGRDSRVGSGSVIAGQLSIPSGSIISPNSILLC
jgi:mannose-1-phosphate guanylyltransferase